ncbi:MAG: sodium:solute symporter family transporter [Pyrinomonadaceae bacterium]
MRPSVQAIDYVVLVGYLLLMAGIGAYFMRYMRVGTDFLKGGNRVEWWVAGMASFMSGFSVWTFTGGAGFAYRQGVIGVFLLGLAVPAFFFGYIVFAKRWRRSRVTTVVEYIRSRFGEGTHKTFSWLTGPSQLMFGSVRLFALSSFMSVALGVPVEYLIVICGLVVLAYTSLGGYWAVCFTDMFQFMFLFPIACMLMVLSLANVGGWSGFVAHAPQGFFNPLAGEYGWLFLIVYTISQTTGYNNFGNAQRYFCADTEQSAKRIAILCMILFTIGSVIFYLPPLIARVALPELGTAVNGLKQPSEAAYIAMGLRVLPPGLVGILLAAMLASSMASLSAHNHIITGIFAKDLYQGYLRRDASDRHMLKASRLTSLLVGGIMIGVALIFAQGASGIFTLLFILESIFLIPLGLPLLYGFLVKRGPWWSAVCAYAVGAATSLFVNLYLNRYRNLNLNETYLIGIPAVTTTIAFFIPVLLIKPAGEFGRRVDAFFDKLATPIDTERELGAAGVSGRGQLALVGKVTTGMGLACFAMVAASAPGRSRMLTAIYAVVTTLVGLAFVAAGRVPQSGSDAEPALVAGELSAKD